LALGVEGVEDEGGFAGAAESGDDDVATEGKIEIEALKVVLADATKANALRGGGGWASRGRNGNSDFFNHRPARMDTESKKANAEGPARMLADRRERGDRAGSQARPMRHYLVKVSLAPEVLIARETAGVGRVSVTMVNLG